jgi:hypothetical protein
MKGLQNIIFGLMNGKDEYLRFRKAALDIPDYGNPIHLRHGKIEQKEFGVIVLHTPDGLQPVSRFTDNLKVINGPEKGFQSLSQNLVVLGYNDLSFLGHGIHLRRETDPDFG